MAWLALVLWLQALLWLRALLPPDVPGFVDGFVGRFAGGLPMGLLAWLVFGLVAGLVGGTSDGSPLDPHESWRHDRVLGLVLGFVVGLVLGLVVGLLAWLPPHPVGPAVALVGGLVVGLGCGLVFGLAFWLGVSHAWQTTLAWLQLQRFRRVPTVALMPFLEDAHARGVLRTVGAVYQFRHATLQDQLAGQTTSSPAPSPVA